MRFRFARWKKSPLSPIAPGILRDANCFCYLCQVPTVPQHIIQTEPGPLTAFCVCLRTERMPLAICEKCLFSSSWPWFYLLFLLLSVHHLDICSQILSEGSDEEENKIPPKQERKIHPKLFMKQNNSVGCVFVFSK